MESGSSSPVTDSWRKLNLYVCLNAYQSLFLCFNGANSLFETVSLLENVWALGVIMQRTVA